MLGLDPRSFIAISAAFGVLWAFILFVLRSSFPRDIKGLGYWGWSCAVMAVAAILFAARDAIPTFFSSYLPNLLVAAGIATMHGSVRQFAGMAPANARMALLLGAVAAALAAATFVHDDYRSRIIIMSGVLAVLFGGCARAIFRLSSKGFAERYTGLVFAATAGIMLVRCMAAVLQAPSLDRPHIDSSAIHQVYMATFSFSLVALSVGFLLMVNRELHRKLEALAVHDEQTGAYRRDAFLALLEKEVAESKSRQRPMAVLMIDLDNFKAINDQHGHLTGDRVISDFSAKARKVLRRHDAMGRYGGEEFLLMFPDTSAGDAYAIAERILNAAAQPRRRDIPPYTVSIGIARLDAHCEDPAAIIDAADKALYVAKRAGRNRIEVAGSAQAR